MVFVGNFILGCGTADESLDGMEMLLSAYVNQSDIAIFWSSFLGFMGITISSFCYFEIYRLMAVAGDIGQSIDIMIKLHRIFSCRTLLVL